MACTHLDIGNPGRHLIIPRRGPSKWRTFERRRGDRMAGSRREIATSSKSGDRGSGSQLSWWLSVFLNRRWVSNIFILYFGVDELPHRYFHPVNRSIVRIAWAKYRDGPVSKF